MQDFLIGLITTAVVVGLVELLRFLEKRLIATLTLVGIPFIYIGFSWYDTRSLVFCIFSVAFFSLLAYFGYKKNFNLVVAGLALHAGWDLVFPLFSSAAPDGYDIFCITIDVLLAVYFFWRVNPKILPGNT